MKVVRALAVVAVAAPLAVLPATPALAACDVTVQLPTYSPAEKDVTPGTMVTWCWGDGASHTVTSDDNTSFTSGLPKSSGTFTHTFSVAGTYAYHCNVHSSMTGTIVVGASPTPTHTTPPPTTRPPTTAPPTKTASPTPRRTTTAPTTAPPTTTSAPATTEPAPTTAVPTTVSAAPTTTAAVTTSPSPIALSPKPRKPKTGLAVALGLLVAIGGLGGAAALVLRGRRV